MIVLHNKIQIPRDGFTYHYLPPSQPDKLFTIKPGHSFNEAKLKLKAWLTANPWMKLPTDDAYVEHELLVYNFARLKSTLGLAYALQFFNADASDDSDVAEALKKKQMQTPSVSPPEPRGVVAVLAAARQLGTGARILGEWLGSGAKPVSPSHAELRANTCLRCPLNESGNWFDKLVAVAQRWIQSAVELRNQMELHVPNEEHLQHCTACRCPLALKVWVPIEKLKADTSETTKEKLADGNNCWILREMRQS